MLQQTQVAIVIPYYERFMARFPDVQALAEAPEDEVMHLWTGLGTTPAPATCAPARSAWSRATAASFPPPSRQSSAARHRPLHRRRHPRAVARRAPSHPRRQRQAVLSRVFGIAGDPSSAAVLGLLWQQADACTPQQRAAAYTQAIMDLGATVCSRANPACTVCPMPHLCIAAQEGRQDELPGRKPKRLRKAREATLLIAETGVAGARAILLERARPRHLGGLWSPPQFESEFAALDWCRRNLSEPEMQPERLTPIDHGFTHFDLRLKPVRVRCQRQPRSARASTSGTRSPRRPRSDCRSPSASSSNGSPT